MWFTPYGTTMESKHIEFKSWCLPMQRHSNVVIDTYLIYFPSAFLLLMTKNIAAPVANLKRDFRDALTHLGFTAEQQKAFMQQTGCTNVTMLGLLAVEQVFKVCKEIQNRTINPILVSTIQEQLLLALHYGVTNKQRLHKPVNAASITAVEIFNQAQVLSRILEDECISDKETVATPPDKFKIASTGKIFAEALDTYLGQLKGTGRIPLKYVICQYEVPVPDTVFKINWRKA